MAETAPVTVLDAPDWRSRAAAHRARAERWTLPARRRRGCREPHPVEDFLFTYYPFPFAKLEEWHPPAGVALKSVEPLPHCWTRPPYRRVDDVVIADPAALPDKQRARLHWLRELLVATRDRPPIPACHGLHEWAMVYRGAAVRHAGIAPLRLPQQDIDALVESRPIRCSHFDAFRFFTPPARPLNKLQPTREAAPDFEQRGCLHANMDLYKWAFKLAPFTPSELVADCFELARDIRELDMRASPYDLASLGFPPVRIETTEGRAHYEQHQRAFAARSEPLRARLLAVCDQLIFAST
jgi:hypothetical protein